MLQTFSGNNFTYTKVSKQEQERRHILGRLTGIIASTTEPTRNGRGYSRKLWEKVFEDPIMIEKIKNRCVFGELGHPEDRTEIDMEKAAICLAEVPKLGSDGNLYGVFDILDTPNGRILKSFCDYGTTIGVSSRGQGDLIQDEHGNEVVDPDTYDCECWDAVIVPAVETARMKTVNESLDKKNLKKALKEAVENASADDQRIMKDTLSELNIDLDSPNTDTEDVEDVADSDVEDTEAVDDKEETVDNEVIDINDLPAEGEDDEADTESADDYNFDTENCTPEEFMNFMKEYVSDTAQAIDDAGQCIDKIEDEEKAEEVRAKLDTLKEQSQLLADEFAKISSFLNGEIDSLEDESEEVDDEEVETEEEPEEEEKEDDSDADEASDDIDDKDEEDEAEDTDEADDDGADEIVESLKKSLSIQRKLEQSNKTLQEKLAVSDTKVTKLSEEAQRYKDGMARMSEVAKSGKALKEKVDELTEALKSKDVALQESKKQIAEQQQRINRLVAGRKAEIEKSNNLTEGLRKSQIDEVKAKKRFNEELARNSAENDEKVAKLNEQLITEKAASEKQIKALKEDVAAANKSRDQYKNLANGAINKYIELKAMTLGLTEAQIKRKLGKTFTLDTVDQVCEELKSYNINVGKLPFSVNGGVRIKVNEAHQARPTIPQNDDDSVDEALLRMANLK